MAHVRKQIRDAIKSRLMNLGITGSRVETGRVRPLAEDFQPTLLIYTPVETSQRSAAGRPPIIDRPLTIHIDARVSGADVNEDDLDAIAEQVEPAMFSDPKFGGLLFNLQQVGSQLLMNQDAQGQWTVIGLRIEYRATYRTQEGVPGTAV